MALLGLAGSATAGTMGRAYAPKQIEAVFLYNFAEFVDWPAASFAAPDSPVVIGVLGKDPFGPVLDEVVRDERAGERPIVVRRFARVREIDQCNILYIADSENSRVGQICSELKNRSILTVSGISNFANRGGMIELVRDTERIRLRIALKQVRAESLSISAKLLRAAEVVSNRFRRAVVDRLLPPAGTKGISLLDDDPLSAD